MRVFWPQGRSEKSFWGISSLLQRSRYGRRGEESKRVSCFCGVLKVLKMPFRESMFWAFPTCTWHITRLSFICFLSGKIKAFLAPQSVPHGDYSSRLWPSHCARLCGQCLVLECGLVPSLSLLEIPREESNAHRNLVISSSPSPRRDATLLRSEGVGLALAYGYRRAVNRVLRSPS